MATYSTSLKLTLLADGEQSGVWGQTQNTNLGTLLEEAITGVVSFDMANANYTLSNYNGASDEARNAVLIATGTNSAQRDVIAPLVEKFYTIVNNTSGGYSIRIRGSSGDAVIIPNGLSVPVYCDGINFYAALNGTPGNFTAAGNISCVGATLAGALSGTTATFSGAISSVSPSFTGTPTVPTAVLGTTTTQAASTAFVANALAAANFFPSGGIIMWSGTIATIPSGWYLCNGSNGTPDLRDKFIVGAYADDAGVAKTNITGSLTQSGGSKDAITVSHTHSVTDPGHTHAYATAPSKGLSSGGDPNGVWGGGSGGGNNATSASNTTGISIASSGSSGTNANLPPYYALAYIMKS